MLAWLRDAGIGAGVHYPVPLHLQPAYADLGYSRGQLPVTEQVADTCLSLPLYPEMTGAQQNRVVDAVKAFLMQEAVVAS
jgi:dTDP-4-amino-4,6-dideoxygalactose transaminase